MFSRSFDYPYSGIIKCGLCRTIYADNASVHGNKKHLSYRCLNKYAKGTCNALGISEIQLNKLMWIHIKILENGIISRRKKKWKSVRNASKLDDGFGRRAQQFYTQVLQFLNH